MKIIIVLLSLVWCTAFAQQENSAELYKKAYTDSLARAGKYFVRNHLPKMAVYNRLGEQAFLFKIDSSRESFNNILNHFSKHLASSYVRQQALEIKFYFDRFFVEYLLNHENYTGEAPGKQRHIQARIQYNERFIGQCEWLNNSDYVNYIHAYLDYCITMEQRNGTNRFSDNQQLNYAWALIKKRFKEKECADFWRYQYLYYHIDNNGIKSTGALYRDFISTCADTSFVTKIKALYKDDSEGRVGHIVAEYKSLDSVSLDIHIFLPKTDTLASRRTIVLFHGGSWTEGKPDWFFPSCANYANKGWVACVVEYRTYSRHGTLPFDAVKDARSAIRWLRQNAVQYGIDTGNIVVCGNSAGGHLALCCALARSCNEATDNMVISSVPNAIIVKAGVYDLTDDATSWIRKDLKNKKSVEQISPRHLTRNYLPTALIIHGTEDKNVPFASAKEFVTLSSKAGNRIEFKPIEGAGHFIWLDPKYAAEVARLTSDFINGIK